MGGPVSCVTTDQHGGGKYGSQGQESRANQSGVAAGSGPGDRGIKAAGRPRGDGGVNTDFTPA